MPRQNLAFRKSVTSTDFYGFCQDIRWPLVDHFPATDEQPEE